jgi:putative sterol carrier protein
MERPTKAQQIFLYAAPFPALVFFKIWAGMGQEATSLIIAVFSLLVYCALVIALAYRWDRPTYFDWAVAVYFGVAAVSLVVVPEAASSIFANYGVTGIYASLFSAAFFPPLFGLDPFTYHYAKKSAPKAVWENPIFVRINRIMTYVWAGLFGACVVLSLYPSVLTRAVVPVALLVGCGIPFNRRFPDAYLRRLGLPSLAQQRKMALGRQTQEEGRRVPARPTSAWQAVSGMPTVFNAEAAGDLSAVIGFCVSGSENFEAYLEIGKGSCRLHKKSPRPPDLLIRSPADVWLAISRKERSGQEAFLQQTFTAEGDLGILMRMNQIFGGQP